jgi:serine/threonine protein kinase
MSTASRRYTYRGVAPIVGELPSERLDGGGGAGPGRLAIRAILGSMHESSDEDTLAAEPDPTSDTLVQSELGRFASGPLRERPSGSSDLDLRCASVHSQPGVDVARGTLSLEEGRRYEQLQTLGQGGMGVVELKADRLIGRDVAIKSLRPQLADDHRIAHRFLREAKIQGQLEHPAIVPVYDLGRTDTGSLYFAMKRIKGRTLREILDALRRKDELGERFSQRRLLSAFSQICQAVEFAHSRGVVHRDLKPDNLMFGEHGEVYVLDWGIARLLGRDDEADAIVDLDPGLDGTRQGAVIGTVGYMSPEQAAGEHDLVDRRSDVWSLGAILFELLSLTPLIERGSLVEMLACTTLGVDGDPSRIDPELPPELASLCVAATAARREDRLPSARALSDAIERYLDGDRDARMRREKSQVHARAAEQAAQRAFASDDLELRREAARESGVALALDPGNVDARKTMLELFTRPPRQIPEAAQVSFDADRIQTLRSFYRQSIVAISIYTPLLSGLLVFGLREPWVLYAALLFAVIYVLLCIYGLRDTQPRSYVPLMMHTCTSLTLLFLARLFTPILVLPVIVAMASMVSAAYPGGAPRWTFALVGMLPVLGAGALELLGVWPPTMIWANGTLELRSAAIDLGGLGLVIPALLGLSAFPLLIGTTLSGRVQELADDIVRTAHVQRWQLEQIVPRA